MAGYSTMTVRVAHLKTDRQMTPEESASQSRAAPTTRQHPYR